MNPEKVKNSAACEVSERMKVLLKIGDFFIGKADKEKAGRVSPQGSVRCHHKHAGIKGGRYDGKC